MATLARFCPHHSCKPLRGHLPPLPRLPLRRSSFPCLPPSSPLTRGRFVLLAASSSFDELHAKGKPHSSLRKNSVLSNLIHEIEPLDVSLIQKDVPSNAIDAMKRTISSMLGLLPSDQFHVSIEAFWEPLTKLLVSSIMTGYTLRNAEYRLCLERNLDIHEEPSKNQETEKVNCVNSDMLLDGNLATLPSSEVGNFLPQSGIDGVEEYKDGVDLHGLGEITPEVQEYISYLESRLSLVKEELSDMKRKNSALQMQHFVGEEKNDLLDYLRSLEPEKVAELSEPTCPEVQEAVKSVVHGLLATLSPKVHSKTHPESTASGLPSEGNNDNLAELLENTSLHFQPLISVSRDYLARLLFWCMLLGHYIRGLEYRLELMQLLSLSSSVESILHHGDQVM